MARTLQGFQDQPWIDLVSGHAPNRIPMGLTVAMLQGRSEREALAWVDATGQRVPETVLATAIEASTDPGRTLADYALLGRMLNPDGSTVSVRIRADVLYFANRKSLLAAPNTVVWQQTEIWLGQLDRDAAEFATLDPLDLALHGDDLAYHWPVRRERGPSFLGDILRVALTPLTAVLDLAIQTNPLLAPLAELFKPDKPKFGPRNRR